MAATCLYVATKVEESTRRIKDFVQACAQKASKNDKLQLTEDSKVSRGWDIKANREIEKVKLLCLVVGHRILSNGRIPCYVMKWCCWKRYALI